MGRATVINHVLVNGVPVLRRGELTRKRPGRVLGPGRDTDGFGVGGT